jgi:hypothetical protein
MRRKLFTLAAEASAALCVGVIPEMPRLMRSPSAL